MKLVEVMVPCTRIRCHKCCIETMMELSESDIERIAGLGYRIEDFAVKGEDGVYRLRNVNGHCVFLTAEGKCSIYEHRPLGCRLYPVVCVEGEGLGVDQECPLAYRVLETLKSDKQIVAAIAAVISREFRVRCPPRLVGLV